MTFIAIIVSLMLELFSPGLQRRRSLQWFERYFQWLSERMGGSARWDGPTGIVIVLVLPLLVVGVLQVELRDVWFGLLDLAFGIVVLTYCLRYQSLDHRVDDFVDASESGNDSAALGAAEAILGNKPSGEAPAVRELTDSVLVQANERLFAVVFWFVLLGPIGAAFYRLSWALLAQAGRRAVAEEGDELSEDQGLVEAALRLQGILDWLPARLLAFAYGLVGSFEDALQEWRQVHDEEPLNFVEANFAVLRRSGSGALRLERHTGVTEAGEALMLEPSAVKAARGLILRSLVFWVSVIAVVTLIGWAH